MARQDVTTLLRELRSGDRSAADRLLPLVYDALHARAVRILAGRNGGGLWQPTAVVDEAFVKLVDQRAVQWQDRLHFHGIAATVMRRIVGDWARAELRQKRDAGRRTPLPEGVFADGLSVEQVAEIDEALDGLAAEHERSALVVELRFYGGLTMPEIAEKLEVSLRTVEGDWQFARTWLHARLTT